MGSLSKLDFLVFVFYFFTVAIYGWWIYKKKKKANPDSKDYFLAEGSLTWWAIGSSLIASNISAEQFIGMSGSGFKMGLAIASYEWIAAATLIVVAVFFMPVYLKNKIYTMPQFIEQRYNSTVALIVAVFWLLLYIIVNLTSILYLGAIAINSLSGISHTLCMIGLAIFAVAITLGGMKVIGYTDIVQVVFLILGGLATTYLALNLVSTHTSGSGVWNGFLQMLEKADSHFHMILQRDNPSYLSLPGLTVLLGGMWVANFSYWGCNQYITQRALGADLNTARNGILFAAFLKLLMPIIVVLPGIAAYVLYQQGAFQEQMMVNGHVVPDRAYPSLLNLLPAGMKGLAFAALTAAIVASLAGKTNSISTIFSLDIYKKRINPNASETDIINIGKLTIVISLVLAIIIAPFLGIDKEGGFQIIQEYTGFVSPGIFAMFLMGFFWKKTNSAAAVFALVGGVSLCVFLKVIPSIMDISALTNIGFAKLNDTNVYEIPFLDRMGIVFVICIITMFLISHFFPSKGNKEIVLDNTLFETTSLFKTLSAVVILLLIILYIIFW